MHQRLRPHAPEAATPCTRGCDPMHQRLRPAEAATPCTRPHALEAATVEAAALRSKGCTLLRSRGRYMTVTLPAQGCTATQQSAALYEAVTPRVTSRGSHLGPLHYRYITVTLPLHYRITSRGSHLGLGAAAWAELLLRRASRAGVGRGFLRLHEGCNHLQERCNRMHARLQPHGLSSHVRKRKSGTARMHC